MKELWLAKVNMLNQTHTITCFSTLPSQSTSAALTWFATKLCPLSPCLFLFLGCCLLPHQAMSLATSDTVASVAELLDRVRACIGNVSPGTMVSLTIDVVSGGQRRVLCLAVRPDDCAALSSADPLLPSLHIQPSEQSTTPICVNAEVAKEHSEAASRNTEQQLVQDELVDMDMEMESETGEERDEETNREEQLAWTSVRSRQPSAPWQKA